MNITPSDLNATTRSTRERWNARYREGVTPWDTQQTPPEVVDFWRSGRLRTEGIALDLGCGPGTNVRYLAGLGLHAIGIDIAGAPLLTAQRRLVTHAPSLQPRAHFICSDVCRLPFTALGASYTLDVGCLHSLPRNVREDYCRQVIANLAPGGYYHLYAFDADPANPEPASGPAGLDEGEVAARFAPGLTLIEEAIARPDRRPCRWYLLQRPQ